MPVIQIKTNSSWNYYYNNDHHMYKILDKVNHVYFIQQLANNVHSFSSELYRQGSIHPDYKADNIIGPRIKFPKYGDFPQTSFAMRTYGLWWDKAPSRLIDYMPQNNMDVVSQDYIRIDAVMLMGTSELILPKDQSHKQNLTNLLKSINCKYPCYGDIHNLTPDYKNAHLDIIHLLKTLNEYCVIYKSDIPANFHERKLISQLGPLYYLPPLKEGSNNMQHFLSEEPTKFMKDKLSSDKSKKPLHCSFSALPDEVIIKILKYLDLKSLCRISRINKRFNNLTQDPFLYTRLNLKPYWYNIDMKALHYLAFKCKYLQQLDLSWCDSFSVPDLEKFLDTCGSLLTHLRLNCCSCIDDFAMLKISKTCRNLKELGLRNCDLIKKGFSYLESLEFLEYLDLYRTCIKKKTLCKILRRNQRMRHLHISDIGGEVIYRRNMNVDEVAMELKNSCPDLESIDLSRTCAYTLTFQGIDALAHCKNLREVDFSYCGSTIGDSFLSKLFFSCEHLEKVFLASFRELTERDLRALTQCKNLKQLNLSDTSITTKICHAFFVNCYKLEMIDLSFCNNITDCSIQQWQQKYTHINIKRVKI